MNQALPYNIILADDHTLLRDALAKLINDFDEFTVLAQAADGNEVIEAVKNGPGNVDIILMDLNMPNMDGYDTAKWIGKKYPGIKIVILTMYDSEVALIRLLQAGVNGFLKKDIHPHELKRALLTIATGEYYYSNHTTNKMASLFRKTQNYKSALEKLLLDDTEIEFLKFACTEMTYVQIADKMHLTPRQIDRCRDNLFEKLDVKSRVGLVIFAIKNGIVTF